MCSQYRRCQIPRSPLPIRLAFRRSPLVMCREKPRLDQHPPHCKVRVAFWQRPYCVQVIRQDHECINVKRVPPFYLFHSRAQNRHVVHQQAKLTLHKVHREEVGAAFCIGTPISHFRSIVWLVTTCHERLGFAGSPQPTGFSGNADHGFFIRWMRKVSVTANVGGKRSAEGRSA